MSRSIKIRQSILAVSCGSIIASTAAASPQLYDFLGTKNNDRLGAAVANAGDVNGDGYNDILGGAPENGNLFFAGNGFVRLYSGKTGAVLMTIDGDPAGLSFGASVAGNVDVNNDGTLDFIVGSPFSDQGAPQAAGYVSVRSGVNGAQIHGSFGQASHENIGIVVCGFGDLNGDGFDEYGAGSHVANSDRGVARVYNGQTGAEMYQFDGTGLGDRVGISISGIGDITGDGVRDILVGSAYDGYYAYNGATGAQIRHTLMPADPTFGVSIASLDDVSGDGVDDIVVGSTQFNIFSPGTGRIYVINGATGATLFTANGASAGDTFGEMVADAGDWNADGKTDILVTSNPQQGGNFVDIRSGANSALLAQFLPDSAGDDIGRSLAGLGDIDGDGKVEIAMGAPETSHAPFTFDGLIRVMSSPFDTCGGTSLFCNSLVNSTNQIGTIAAIGSTSVANQSLILQSTKLPASVPGLFFYGSTQVSVPFGEGVRCVGGTIQRLTVSPTNGAGIATAGLFTDPNNTIVGPGVWQFQFWHRDNVGAGPTFNFSKAIEISFCP